MACSIPDCGKPRYATTSTCYDHHLARPRCDVDGCNRLPVKASTECYVHRERQMVGPRKQCEFEGCDRRATWRGLCQPHGKQRSKGQPLKPLRERSYHPHCIFEGCDRPVCAGGLCATHYDQKRNGRELRPIPVDRRRTKRPRPDCKFDGCGRLARGYAGVNLYCKGHYSQLHAGHELRPLYQRKQAPGHVNRDGYRLISIGGRPIMEHRAVMERIVGRPLEPYENVHHLNGDKLDNRPENLELWVTKQPRGQRVEDLVQFVIEHYRPQLLRRLEQERGS